ncbi:3-hydroxy-acyl-CoA-dehydrogenase [Lyophyllum atratum]|nr:3-hydroxy-acyl-CoA-dehydrogenase [Lyophyllum atratum]
MKIDNRTFIVSGGCSGLGLATVKDLLEGNAYVAVLDVSPLPAVLPLSTRCIFVKTDVRDVGQVEAAVKRVVEWTRETGAELGGVINSAGLGRNELLINAKGKPHGTDVWDLTMGVNVAGTFHLTRLALEHLVRVKPEDTPDGERGVIILVASEAAFEGQPGQTAYAASKGAIRSMALPMARDLARHHVRVVAIAPGPFTTPLTGSLSNKVQGALNSAAVLYPKRFGTPGEFAKTVRWALDCAYVNGETIRLTGGGRVPAFL